MFFSLLCACLVAVSTAAPKVSESFSAEMDVFLHTPANTWYPRSQNTPHIKFSIHTRKINGTCHEVLVENGTKWDNNETLTYLLNQQGNGYVWQPGPSKCKKVAKFPWPGDCFASTFDNLPLTTDTKVPCGKRNIPDGNATKWTGTFGGRGYTYCVTPDGRPIGMRIVDKSGKFQTIYHFRSWVPGKLPASFFNVPSQCKTKTQLLTEEVEVPEEHRVADSEPEVLPLTAAPSGRWILAAPWTPFHKNQSVNLEPIAAQAAFAKEMGVSFIWVSGGMAQFETLTASEREAIATAWVREGHKHGLFVCVHVGHLEIPVAHRLAVHAQKIGADAVSSVPPFYGAAPTMDELYLWFGEVLKGITLPFYYYHIPVETHVPLKIHEFLEGAVGQGKLPTLRGIKFVDDDIPDFYKSITYMGGKFAKDILWAPEPKMQAVPFGARSIVLAESFFGNLEGRMLDAAAKGNAAEALSLQEYCQGVRAIIGKYGGSADKQVMRGFGIDLGPPRLPKIPLPESEYTKMIAEIKTTDFFTKSKIKA